MGKSPPASAVSGSYDPAYFGPLFAIEDRHFWFRARNRVIDVLVKQAVVDLPPGYRALEVGCGTGNTLRVLDSACARGVVVGLDLFAEGLQYARRRTGRPLVQGDMRQPPFGARFDLIGLFDVLEHLPDDEQVLRDLYAMLNEGGTLLLTVPAHPALWSYFDEISRHQRRYVMSELSRKLVQTGYRVEYLTQYMASIYPMVWLGRKLAGWSASIRRMHRDDLASSELRITPVVSEMLTWLLLQETRLIARRRHLPIGTSLVAVARRLSRERS